MGRAYLRMIGIMSSSKNPAQHAVDSLAAGSDEERYHDVGRSARRASVGGFLGTLILFGIFVVVALLLFSDFMEKGGCYRAFLID